MDHQAFYRAFKAACLKLGLSSKLNVHSLRHTFGTRMAKIAKPALVQTLMGHGSYKTTQKYVHLTDDDLMAATAALWRRSRLREFVVICALLALTGCNTREDTGVVAARMEAQDDAACKGRQDYNQCRSNLMGYRQQALAEQRQRQARSDAAADSLIAAGQAMQSIGNPPTNVNVTCFGCR
jgi:hypothetical protein